MVGHKRERVLGRVGRAVDAAARDFAREAAQLENGGGREAAAERLVEQQVEVFALCFETRVHASEPAPSARMPSWSHPSFSRDKSPWRATLSEPMLSGAIS